MRTPVHDLRATGTGVTDRRQTGWHARTLQSNQVGTRHLDRLYEASCHPEEHRQNAFGFGREVGEEQGGGGEFHDRE